MRAAIIALILMIGSQAGADATKTWKVVSPSIVSVLPTWPGYTKPGFGAPVGAAPEGTGIAISKDGHILTAAHVISKATTIEIRDGNNNLATAHPVFVSTETDLAIIKVDVETFAIDFSDDVPEIGSETCLVSNSFGLGLGITCGVVSAIGRKNIGFNRTEDFIQTDAASNPGSSGGALVNMDGFLIGMMSGIFTKNTDTNAGVNFAVSGSLIQQTIVDFLN